MNLVLQRVADHLASQRPGRPLTVAVDGITAAGKSTFAASLRTSLVARGRETVHLTMDDFHHPRAHRYRQGRDSAVGYYEDAYDFDALARLVLDPAHRGDGVVTTRVLDLDVDLPVPGDLQSIGPDAIIVVDGSFLQHPGLAWDEVIWLRTTFEAARARGSLRDAQAFGGVEAAAAAFDRRYHAAGRLYLAERDPDASAGIVVDHEDPALPVLMRVRGIGTGTHDAKT